VRVRISVSACGCKTSGKFATLIPAGSSDDQRTVLVILKCFGLVARRPELLKRVVSMFAYFLAGEGGLIEPRLLELMRVRGAHLNACTYCATVRLQPVAEEVKAKESALGVCDISGMTKSQAVETLRDKLRKGEFTPREAAAISLVDQIVIDPHSVDDTTFAELRNYFSEEEIIPQSDFLIPTQANGQA
jgi:alkylhydroperoxidase family enzyme